MIMVIIQVLLIFLKEIRWWNQNNEIIADEPSNDDFFGRSVVTNAVGIVGSYGDDDKGENAGAAYIFGLNTSGNWTQLNKFVASDGVNGDIFGVSVSVNDNYAIIGAIGYDDKVEI